jgi:hypothetical protein
MEPRSSGIDMDIEKVKAFLAEKENRISRMKEEELRDIIEFSNSRLSVLKSRMNRDVEMVEQLFEKLDTSYKRYKEQSEYAFLVESGFYMSRIYTGFERMFKNIATAFENTVDGMKSLLDRMALDIENIRPAVISDNCRRHLDELRTFRHFFRHTYDMDLEDEKFSVVANAAGQLKASFTKDIQLFLQFIDRLLEE